MFRFAIRDLLWLTVLVAMGVAWGVDRAGQQAREAETAKIQGTTLRQLRLEMEEARTRHIPTVAARYKHHQTKLSSRDAIAF